MEDDNLAEYRVFCANRMRRLERCKKSKSFYSFDEDQCRIPSVSTESSTNSSNGLRAVNCRHLSFNDTASFTSQTPTAATMTITPTIPEQTQKSTDISSSNNCNYELLRQSMVSICECFASE
uniref:Uncharacterized protein n=1 Tax=Syphacia muris TaxID=451379 RepID=A0A0N5ATN5_9BILA